MPCQPQSGSAFERIQQSRWILSGRLARSTMRSQRPRCCTFSKNLNYSLASLIEISKCASRFSYSTNSENDENHGLGAQAGPFRRSCSISLWPRALARSSGVLPQLKANLSPEDQFWVGRPGIRCVTINWKQLCLTLNLCFLSFPTWNFLNVERRNQI